MTCLSVLAADRSWQALAPVRPLPYRGHNRTQADRFQHICPGTFVTESIVCAPFWQLNRLDVDMPRQAMN
jgi:hypothetical protein